MLGFVRADSNRTRGNGFKPLKAGGFRLDVRKKPFTKRVVKGAQGSCGCPVPISL